MVEFVGGPKLIDGATGEPFRLGPGDRFSWRTTVVDGVAVPDGLTADGDEATFVTFERADG